MQYQVEKIYPVIDTNREKGQNLIKIIQSQLSHLLVDSPEKADLIVVWGWDGYFMHSIKKYLSYKKPFFGVNCGTLWFLLNSFDSWEIFKKENIQVDLLKQLTLKAEITTTTSLPKSFKAYLIDKDAPHPWQDKTPECKFSSKGKFFQSIISSPLSI